MGRFIGEEGGGRGTSTERGQQQANVNHQQTDRRARGGCSSCSGGMGGGGMGGGMWYGRGCWELLGAPRVLGVWESGCMGAETVDHRQRAPGEGCGMGMDHGWRGTGHDWDASRSRRPSAGPFVNPPECCNFLVARTRNICDGGGGGRGPWMQSRQAAAPGERPIHEDAIHGHEPTALPVVASCEAH